MAVACAIFHGTVATGSWSVAFEEVSLPLLFPVAFGGRDEQLAARA